MSTTPAFERGARRGRHVRNLQTRRGIFAAAENPYTRAATRADWQAGFNATYYGESSR